jgi:hypothetical protein
MDLAERFHREEENEFEMGDAAGEGPTLQRRNKAFTWRKFHECGGSNVTTEYTEHTEESSFRVFGVFRGEFCSFSVPPPDHSVSSVSSWIDQ